MRAPILLAIIITLSGCSALMVSGGVNAPSPSRASSPGASDSSITAAVEENFAADASVNSFMLGVRSNSGKVTLTGTVDSYVAYEQAERIATRTPGVKAIENRIKVEAVH